MEFANLDYTYMTIYSALLVFLIKLMVDSINDLNSYFKEKYQAKDWQEKLNYYKYVNALFVPGVYFKGKTLREGYKQLLFYTFFNFAMFITSALLLETLGII